MDTELLMKGGRVKERQEGQTDRHTNRVGEERRKDRGSAPS